MTLYGEEWTDRDTEAYAHALYDLMEEFCPCGHHKSYDPLTIVREAGRPAVAHSYVFDLWDGGRHHDMAGKTLDDLRLAMLKETARIIAGRRR